MDLPREHDAYSEPRKSLLAESPLDNVIMIGVPPGPANTDIFVQFLLEQGAEPLGGSSAYTTPLGIVSKRGYLDIARLILRVIDRQTTTQEELLLKLGVLLEIENPDLEANDRFALYYVERCRILL